MLEVLFKGVVVFELDDVFVWDIATKWSDIGIKRLGLSAGMQRLQSFLRRDD